MKLPSTHTSLNILLADDDKDDRFFFTKALEKISTTTNLKTVNDGEKLMAYLNRHSEQLPHVLFLDLNMPRKNGSECLKEIKSTKELQQLPVIIYSTSLNNTIADVLYQKGAHFYLRKCPLDELTEILEHILVLMIKNEFARPARKEFIVNGVKH